MALFNCEVAKYRGKCETQMEEKGKEQETRNECMNYVLSFNVLCVPVSWLLIVGLRDRISTASAICNGLFLF